MDIKKEVLHQRLYAARFDITNPLAMYIVHSTILYTSLWVHQKIISYLCSIQFFANYQAGKILFKDDFEIHLKRSQILKSLQTRFLQAISGLASFFRVLIFSFRTHI